MARNDLLERIARAPILCDGAMKTEILDHAVKHGLIPDSAARFSTGYCNVDHPDIVEAVHRDYLEAGAELIITNTFKAGSYHVLKMGRTGTLTEAARESVKLIDAATKIARRACGNRAWVLGDIGHVISHMPAADRGDDRLLRDEYRRQILAMREAGADAIIVEYMADPRELAVAVQAAKEVAEWPVLVTPVFQKAETAGTYATHRPDRNIEVAGVSIDAMIKAAVESGADVIGAHCGVSLEIDDYLAIAECIVASPHRPAGMPVMIKPNGSEKGGALSGDRDVARPEALAASVPQFLKRGVGILGGCCGTTPADIRAMAAVMP